MASNTLDSGGLVYNNANTLKATAVTVTSNYGSTSLKSSSYGSSVVTITAAARNKSINIQGNSKANKIIGTSAKDTLNGGAGNDTLTGGDGKDIFVYESGAGNDVITDYTAGEDTIKIASGAISSYSFSSSDAIFKIASNTLRIKGGKTSTITVVDSKNKISTYTDGLIYNGSIARATAMTVTSNYSSTLAADSYSSSVVTIDSSARTKAMNITGNAKSNKIVGTSGNDTLNGKAGNDTLFGGSGKDLFIYEGGSGNDVIADYTAGQDTIKISGGDVSAYSISGSTATFKIGSNTLRVNNAKTAAVLVVDDNKNATIYQGGAVYNNANTSKATAITLTASYGNSLAANTTAVSINAATRNSAIKITGNTKNNALTGGSGKDVLNGGKGNDTLIGGKSSDTLTGGDGADVFVYAEGDGSDLITDYEAGKDLIKLTSGAIKSYSVKNNDAILKIGSSSLTVKGAGASAISVLDADDMLTVYKGGLIYNNPQISRADAVSISTDYDGEFYSYGASVETIDASARSKAIEITGNGADNLILGGKGKDTLYGGRGADTLYGGKGNDLLTGGEGADVFYFAGSDGNDTITDYEAGDILSVAAAVSSYSEIEGGVVLKIGSGKVTLQNPGAAVTVVGSDSIASIYSGEKIATETWKGGAVTFSGESVEGTAANDTLAGTSGNDTYTGHAGDDIFVYGGGNDYDVITDYGLGDDTISIGAGSITGAMIVDSDVFLAISGGVLKLIGAKDKAVVIDAGGRELEYNNGVYIGERVKLTAGDDTYSNSQSQLVIYGFSGNDEITNERGTTGVTIVGGEGHDTIRNHSTGGNIYRLDVGNGTNTIVGYNENDTIYVAASSYTTARSGNDFIVLAGTDSFFLRHAAQFPVTVKNSRGEIQTFNGRGTRTVTGDMTNTEIVNTNGSATIIGAATFNYINNYGSGVSIAGGSSVDYINNHGDSVSISGGKDDDYIWSYGEAAVIDGGAGADRILSYSDGATIRGGTGADIVYLSVETTLGNLYRYASGDGNDVVYNFTDLDTLEVSGGGYSTTTSGENVVVKIGKGAVTLVGAAELSGLNITGEIDTDTSDTESTVISLTAGDDTFSNSDSGQIIYGLAGDDTIQNTGDSVTINAGTGDDVISLGGSGNFLQYENGDGNDMVYNFAAADTLEIIGISYSTVAGGSDVVVNVGEGKITLAGAGSLSAINIDGEYETEPMVISLTAGDDTFSNSKSGRMIYGLEGDDTIQNTGDGVTINAGSGDDVISLGGSGNFLQYENGDGNDMVYNFAAADTLEITGGTYSTVASGSDVIVNVGEGKITLAGAGSLSAINIDGEYETEPTVISLTAGDDTFSNSDSGQIIYGLEGDDTIQNTGDGVTINAGSGDDIISLGGSDNVVQYSVGDGNDVIYNFAAADTLEIIGISYSTVAGGSDVIVNVGEGKITLAGAGLLSAINIDGEYDTNAAVTSLTAGNDTFSNSDSGQIIYGLAGDDTIQNTGDGVTINAGTGDDIILLGGSGNVVQYSVGDGNDVIYNFAADDTLEVIGSYSTVASGADLIVNVGEGQITLAGANFLSSVNIDGEYDTSTALEFADDEVTAAILLRYYSPAEGDVQTFDGVDYTYADGEWIYESEDETLTADSETAAAITSEYYAPHDGEAVEFDGVIYTYDGEHWTYEVISDSNAFYVPWFAEDDNFAGGAELDSLIETSIANSGGDLSMRGSELDSLAPVVAYRQIDRSIDG